MFDFNGNLLFSNRSARAILNLQETVTLGRKYIDLFMGEPENDAFNDIIFSGIQNRETHVYREVSFRRSDGNRIDIAVSTSFLRDQDGNEEDEGVVVVFRDITESKALDRARQRVIDHLSHELKTPLAIIGATLKRIDRHDTAKFVERIAHNLKRLQAIQIEVEEIVKEAGRKDTTAFESMVAQVLDLLDIVAEKNGAYEEPVRLLKEEVRGIFNTKNFDPLLLDVGPLAEEVVNSVRMQASHRHVSLRMIVNGGSKVIMDPEMIRKVLLAPLKNAMEATPDGGEIVVKVASTDRSGVAIEIRDTGVGITPESLKQIFGGFYHAKDTNLYATKKPFDFGAGGKGLDLLRLKVLSKAYNFHIECESTRCRFIPRETDLCPGSIEECIHANDAEECARAGGTVFRLIFPRT